MSKRAVEPLYISMKKIRRAQESREIQALMDAGGPGPIEETYRLTERYDPTFEQTIEQQRENYRKERDHD